jgi:crotonobetainyl-CoA:carnitine CoA-transferase CaiB-like acyl-CoA transferase
VYPSAGDDQWVAVAVMDDDAWGALCIAVGWDADPSLRAATARIAARDALDERLAAWTSTRTKEDAAELLQEHGVSAMPVMGPHDHHADPHLLERGAIVTLHHPEIGDERHIGNPLRFSRLPQRRAEAAPLMGADTEAVLTSVLGLDADEVAKLVADGVCR